MQQVQQINVHWNQHHHSGQHEQLLNQIQQSPTIEDSETQVRKYPQKKNIKNYKIQTFREAIESAAAW